MKITKRQLRRIIKEEQRRLDEGLHGVIAGVGFGSPPAAPDSVYSSPSVQNPASLAMRRSVRMSPPRVSELGISRGDYDPRGDVPYEKMVQAINTNIGEAMKHGAFAKKIYDIMFESGWIE